MSETALKCKACGAVWMSPVTRNLAERQGECLRCGEGPLVESEPPDESPDGAARDGRRFETRENRR